MATSSTMATASERVSSGLPGLDLILHGGLPAHHLYLIEGKPGAGKTTLALEFLREGVCHQEPVLYITLSESASELQAVARSHGWSLDGIHIIELDSTESLSAERDYTIFPSSEVELGETMHRIFEEVQNLNPRRVVFDSLSELRLLASDPLRYRRQILGLKQFFNGRQSTILMIDDLSEPATDQQLHSIAHGVVRLETYTTDYSSTHRRLRVVKLRGSDFQNGYHDFIITRGKVEVYPRLIAAQKQNNVSDDKPWMSSGIAELDQLMGNKIRWGVSILLTGPAGAGKSSLAMQYLNQGAENGDYVVGYLFEEGIDSFIQRGKSLGLPLEKHIRAGRLLLHQIDPAQLTPGQFAYHIQNQVENKGARIVLIDSINGYLNAMPNEKYLLIQMHELLTYLNKQGVITLLTLAQQGLIGAMSTPLDVSYVADIIVLLRYFETQGEIRKAISILKNRQSVPERTIREFRLDSRGIWIGPPLKAFKGVLTGNPEYLGEMTPRAPKRSKKK